MKPFPLLSAGPLFPGMVLLFVFSVMTACHSDREVDRVGQRFQQYQRQFPARQEQQLLSLADLPERLDSLQRILEVLIQVDTHTISTAGKQERLLLLQQLEREWTNWEPYRSNPSLYNLGGLLKKQLVEAEGVKVDSLHHLFDKAETYYQYAQRNLLVSDISLYRLAAQKQYLTLEFLRGELPDSLDRMPLSHQERADLDDKIGQTRRIIKDYLAFCESSFLNHRDSVYQGEPPGR